MFVDEEAHYNTKFRFSLVHLFWCVKLYFKGETVLVLGDKIADSVWLVRENIVSSTPADMLLAETCTVNSNVLQIY